jgi:hypothetical protein
MLDAGWQMHGLHEEEMGVGGALLVETETDASVGADAGGGSVQRAASREQTAVQPPGQRVVS